MQQTSTELLLIRFLKGFSDTLFIICYLSIAAKIRKMANKMKGLAAESINFVYLFD